MLWVFTKRQGYADSIESLLLYIKSSTICCSLYFSIQSHFVKVSTHYLNSSNTHQIKMSSNRPWNPNWQYVVVAQARENASSLGKWSDLKDYVRTCTSKFDIDAEAAKPIKYPNGDVQGWCQLESLPDEVTRKRRMKRDVFRSLSLLTIDSSDMRKPRQRSNSLP